VFRCRSIKKVEEKHGFLRKSFHAFVILENVAHRAQVSRPHTFGKLVFHFSFGKEFILMQHATRNAMEVVSIITLVLGLALASSGPVFADAVIYEPFDYSPDGDRLSTYTQSGLGLSGDWGDSGTLVATPGLTYGSLTTSGNKVTMSDDTSWASTGSTLNGLLDDDDTLWFSVLVTPHSVSTNPDFGFALATDRGNDSNNVPLQTANGGNGLGFRFKGGLKATAWSGGPASSAAGASVSGETTYLVVGEMIFGATDTINIYLPDTDLNLGSVVSTQTATLDQTAFNMITFMDKAADPRDEVDEIRFGATYADVTPGGTLFDTADFDTDGDVDGDDFGLWSAGFGIATGAQKIDGDADEDGDVDGDDFGEWSAQFGNVGPPSSGASVSAVPEPTTLAMLGLGSLAMCVRRRR
jgi:hypothetical protein